ncbi:hypothetical protein PAERUG_E15_London_28_01_14_09464 [Pseudomonas aeruginosa]|nr:hypothetical protein PAERUG_E15_London_28_01_14_09464 [Pseudomonas aeruginosa]
MCIIWLWFRVERSDSLGPLLGQFSFSGFCQLAGGACNNAVPVGEQEDLPIANGKIRKPRRRLQVE